MVQNSVYRVEDPEVCSTLFQTKSSFVGNWGFYPLYPIGLYSFLRLNVRAEILWLIISMYLLCIVPQYNKKKKKLIPEGYWRHHSNVSLYLGMLETLSLRCFFVIIRAINYSELCKLIKRLGKVCSKSKILLWSILPSISKSLRSIVHGMDSYSLLWKKK